MPTSTFTERLHARITSLDTRVCFGLDPRPEAHPATHPERFAGDPAKVARASVHYFQAIVEATHASVACYKLQSAFFERLGIPGLIGMAQLIADIRAREVPVILDAKRGDVGTTAEAYADAYLREGVFASDALTVNAYPGVDTLTPFVEAARHHRRGLFVLVKTSNPGSGDFQDLALEGGERLYERVADRLSELAADHLGPDGYSPIGAVVGATYPEVLTRLRARLPHSVLLVPGYGAQGGNAADVAAAFDAQGLGAVISSSRALGYPSSGADFASRAAAAVEAMRQAVNEALAGRQTPS